MFNEQEGCNCNSSLKFLVSLQNSITLKNKIKMLSNILNNDKILAGLFFFLGASLSFFFIVVLEIELKCETIPNKEH
jgi:hypothetical protein